jgi:hypothetical protein
MDMKPVKCPECGTDVGLDGASCFIRNCANYGKSIIATDRAIAIRGVASKVLAIWRTGDDGEIDDDAMTEAMDELEKLL